MRFILTKNQMDAQYRHKIHHHAVFKLTDGSTKEGYMQPWDENYVYLTALDGTSAGRVELESIRSIDFPED